MKKINFSKTGRNTFWISFLSGTFLLVSYLVTRADFLLITGFYFVMVAAVINILVLLYELLEFLNHISKKKSSGNSVLLLLINIPITVLYIYIILNSDP
ncbi:hypothetical protein ACM40_01170 [Chryseobacterium sp. BLS98]|uniref:hypothetical protein n=1 Tax=Chryseobacterium sp. BLS98 TaxID=885586 RepID=UPI00065AED8F|nr:hypothetical protein [Chryseobacterium sp. BLS98]KMQ63447.1 hypothetical protein ACM40_01170 [Chryseobacterium sp. BLS98]